MANRKIGRPSESLDKISPTLRAWGMRSWFFIGIALAALTFVVFFTAIASVSVPFVIAVVMAMIFYPLVDMLEKRGINRSIGSILVLLLVTVVIVFTAWLVWAGVYSNSEMIIAQIETGIIALIKLTAQVVPPDVAEQIVQQAMLAIPQVLSGVSSFVVGGFSSLFALFMGVYVAFFLLYYLLSDWHSLSDWVGRHLGVRDKMGIEIANDSTSAVRTYFYALTLANIPVAASVGLTMWLLGLPLAIPVAIVTLITCYIPYLGAIVSALFAGLIALGAGGVWEAVVVVAVIILMQNIIDPIITNYKASDELNMNPIVTLVSTLVGGILFGALGATLASPLAAVMINVHAKIKGYAGDGKSPTESTSTDNS